MGPFDLFNHLLNLFAVPAAMALMLAFAGRWGRYRRTASPCWIKQIAINFVAGAAVVIAALWWTGHDGTMTMYAAMVLVMGSVQWWFQKR